MLSLAAKVLIGVAVGAVATTAVVVAVKVSKKSEEKQMEEKAEEKVGLIQRIKKAATKKVIKILAWVAVHSEQIEATSMIIGLATSTFGIISAVKDFKRGSDTDKKLEEINEKLDSLKDYENYKMDLYNENNKVTFNNFQSVHDHMDELFAKKKGKEAA